MLFPLALLPFAALSGAVPAHAQDDDNALGWMEAPEVQAVGPADRLYGKPGARFSLIVWLDPECPYCKVLGRQPEHVVDSGKDRVNLVVRLYPLPFHGANAVRASVTALCVADQAGARGYYRFLDDWLDRTASNGRGIGSGEGREDPVVALAVAAGARDRQRLATCARADRTRARLTAEMKAADDAGIEGTPQIALRDNRTGHTISVSGAISEDDMRDGIRMLREADDNVGEPGVPAVATR
jgi:protein-disulfide isomerase